MRSERLIIRLIRGLCPVVALCLLPGAVRGQDGNQEKVARALIETFTFPAGLRVEVFADGAPVQTPSAICFDEKGRLLAAESHRLRAGVEKIRDLHGLIRGPDGRIYWSIGDCGYALRTLEGRDLRNPAAGAVFRCEPDGRNLEVYYTGLRNAWELAFDAYGNLFTCDDGSGAWDGGRLIYVLEGGDSGWQAGYPILLNEHDRLGLRTPVCEDVRDRKRRALTPWLVEGLCLPAFEGQPAWILPPAANIGWEASGLAYNYGGTALPATTRNSFFLCKPMGTGGELELFSVQGCGAGFGIREHRDAWMSGPPNSDAEFAPDGKLYLSCRSNGLGSQDAGSVYTVFDPGLVNSVVVTETKRFLQEPLASKSGAELADWLSHEDLRVRLRAQFELAGRGEESVPLFEGALRQKLRPLRRLHAIWGLGQIARSGGAARVVRSLVEAAEDGDSEVRAQAAKTLADVGDDKLARALLTLLHDESPRVRCFACLAAARRKQTDAFPELLRVLEQNADADPFLRHGASVALASLGSEEDLGRLAAHESIPVRRGAVLALRRLGSERGLRNYLSDRDPGIVQEAVRAIHDLGLEAPLAEVAKLLETVDSAGTADFANGTHQLRLIHANWCLGKTEAAVRLAEYASRLGNPDILRINALQALVNWNSKLAVDPVTGQPLPQQKDRREEIGSSVRESIGRLVVQSQGDILAAALRLSREIKLEISSPVLKELVANGEKGAAARVEALEDLSRRRAGGLKDLYKRLLGDEALEVRMAAMKSLLQVDPVQGVDGAIGLLESGGESEKQQAVLALATATGPRATEQLDTLWEEMEAGRGDPSILFELLEAARQRPDMTDRWESYRHSLDPGKPSDTFRECVSGGDPVKGARVYSEHSAARCNHCHTIGTGGGRTGPDLTDIGERRSQAEILESLVDPSSALAPGSGTTLVMKTDGTVLCGNLLKESGGMLQIQAGKAGSVREIPGKEVALRRGARSSMPPMGTILSKRELRDLIAYLVAQKGKTARGNGSQIQE